MAFFTVERVAEVESTNSVLLARAARSACHGQVLVADLQRAGRGQRGRVWRAAAGDAILSSVSWQFAKTAPLDGLSLAVGVVLAEALDAWVPGAVRLKWPNDLLVVTETEAHKIGGILIETVASPDATRTAVIGFGINVRNTPPLEIAGHGDVPKPLAPICLADISHPSPPLDAVLAGLLGALALGLPQFEREGFSAFQSRWWQRRAFAQDAVVARLPDGSRITGEVSAVSERGALVVKTEHGLHTLVSGEVSLRAIGA